MISTVYFFPVLGGKIEIFFKIELMHVVIDPVWSLYGREW